MVNVRLIIVTSISSTTIALEVAIGVKVSTMKILVESSCYKGGNESKEFAGG